MARKYNIKKGLLISLAGIMLALCGAAAAFVSPAQAFNAAVATIAGSRDNAPSPCASAAPNQVCVTSLTFTGVILGGKASAHDIDTGKVTILADMNLRAGVKVNRVNCFWTKKGQKWSNGGYGVNGTEFEIETTPAQLCRSSHSPTGWVKVAGGKTGRRCFNEAKVGAPPGPVAKGRIIWVSNLAQVKLHLHAHAEVYVTAVCGHASGSGTADIVVSLREFARTRGDTQGRLAFSAKAVGKATANAQADIKCQPGTTTPGPTTTVVVTTPAPPPVTTTTNVTTTVPTTPTTPTTTTTPVQPSCTLSVAPASKSDPYTAHASLTTNLSPVSAIISWGDGYGWSGTSGQHTYATPPAGPAGSGVTYTITAQATFANGQTVNCQPATSFFVPAPPPSGNTNPPPPPPPNP